MRNVRVAAIQMQCAKDVNKYPNRRAFSTSGCRTRRTNYSFTRIDLNVHTFVRNVSMTTTSMPSR